MRHYYFIYFFLLLGANGLSAQITLTADNYGSRDTVILQDSVFADSTLLVAPPQGGADQVWDFSDLDLNLLSVNLNFPVADDDTCFTGTTTFRNTSLNFQGFVYPARDYEITNDSGRYTRGQKVPAAKFSLLQVTGNPADTLAFSALNIELNAPFIRFPATFGSAFVDTIIINNPFALTVSGFGLNMTPGNEHTETVYHRDIIGYGTIILPQSDGSVTEPLEVLLSRDSTVTTATYTLGGAPAPPALLQAFGLMEVNVSTRVSYFFHAKGVGRSVARFLAVNDNGEDKFEFSARTVPPGTTTGIRNHELLHLKPFPNPVSPGESIKLAGGTELNAGTLRLLDLQGRVISEQTFQHSFGNYSELLVPATAKAGLYFYQLSNRAGRPVGVGKVMVR